MINKVSSVAIAIPENHNPNGCRNQNLPQFPAGNKPKIVVAVVIRWVQDVEQRGRSHRTIALTVPNLIRSSTMRMAALTTIPYQCTAPTSTVALDSSLGDEKDQISPASAKAVVNDYQGVD